MLSFFNSFRDINTVNILFRMVFAVICGGVIGIERSIKNRPAGFRTHILIEQACRFQDSYSHYHRSDRRFSDRPLHLHDPGTSD